MDAQHWASPLTYCFIILNSLPRIPTPKAEATELTYARSACHCEIWLKKEHMYPLFFSSVLGCWPEVNMLPLILWASLLSLKLLYLPCSCFLPSGWPLCWLYPLPPLCLLAWQLLTFTLACFRVFLFSFSKIVGELLTATTRSHTMHSVSVECFSFLFHFCFLFLFVCFLFCCKTWLASSSFWWDGEVDSFPTWKPTDGEVSVLTTLILLLVSPSWKMW